MPFTIGGEPEVSGTELRVAGEQTPSGLVESDDGRASASRRQRAQLSICLGSSVVVLALAAVVLSNADAGYGCENFRSITGWSLLDCAPSSASSEAPLRQAFRPPRRTDAQTAAMAKIEATAVHGSAEAKDWALSYLASDAVRGRLDASLQHYSDEQLLEMFSWEFERLIVWHNAPLDAAMVERSTTNRDDTPLSITLENGYLQNQCQRQVLGGDQAVLYNLMVQHQFTDIFGIQTDSHIRSMCDYIGTLREANNCMVFHSLNTLKGSQGGWTGGYGGRYVTYVLNRKKMAGRLIWEPGDSGNDASSPFTVDWALGTVDPPAWFHVLKQHNELAPHSIADYFNHWWLPEKFSLSDLRQKVASWSTVVDYEVVSMGTWLPEDLLCIIVQWDSTWQCPEDQPCDSGWVMRQDGLRGTKIGSQVRQWAREHNRPLIWTDGQPGNGNPDGIPEVMILDPYVGFGGNRITEHDLQLFESHWRVPSRNQNDFSQLVGAMPAHLKLNWPSYPQRSACAAQENNQTASVLGVDDNGDCVWFDEQPQLGWECISDGTCEQSARGTFSTQADCLAGCAHSFACVSAPEGTAFPGAKYCQPRPRTTGDAVFTSVHECEAECIPDDKRSEYICASWTWHHPVLWLLVCIAVVASCLVCTHRVAADQDGWSTPLFACAEDHTTCALVVIAPWWQRAKVVRYQEGGEDPSCCTKGWNCWSNTWSGLTYYLMVICTISLLLGNLSWQTLGLVWLYSCRPCSSLRPGCRTRPKLRRQLNIKGTCLEDTLIHCVAHPCALAQEAREVERQRAVLPAQPVNPAPSPAPLQERLLASVGSGGRRP